MGPVSYHYLPNRKKPQFRPIHRLEPQIPPSRRTAEWETTSLGRRIPVFALLFAWLLAALWSQPASAQSRAQLGPLCTSENTQADAQIDACSKIIALKVFSGAQLATVYFWRAVGWNKKGDYVHVIADTTEAIRLKPEQALCNMRGSAYFDKGEYDIAIADFNDALKLGPPSGIIFHNRGNAWRGKGDYAKALAD